MLLISINYVRQSVNSLYSLEYNPDLFQLLSLVFFHYTF